MPTLILMEGSTGAVLTRGGVERTLADPQGQSFPWTPPHPKSHLEDGPLLSCGGRDSNEPMLHEELRHCYKGVYFSAHWVSVEILLLFRIKVFADMIGMNLFPKFFFFIVVIKDV